MAKYSVQMLTRRIAAGSYQVTYLGNEVDVIKTDIGWIATCDVNTSDPVPTKRDAVKSAQYMLVNWDRLKAV